MGMLDKRYKVPASTGGSHVFDFSKYPGVSFWKQKEGPNKINILPYEVSSKNHPLVAKGLLEKGDMDYTLEVWVHTFIGPGNASVVCPKRNYNKPCPICEESEKLKEAGKEKESSALWPKKRMYYNIQDVNDPDKGVQVFEANHKFFEKPLMSLAHDTDDGSPYIDFADLKHGKIVKFTGEKEQFAGKDFIQFANFKFLEREESLKALATSVYPLDTLLEVKTYEEIEKVIYGGSDDDDPVASPDDDDDEPPKKKPPKDDEDDDPPPPKKKPPKDDDDDEPPKKKAEPENKCPHGHVWGKDNDEKPECDKCTEYKACLRAQMSM